MLSEKRIVQNHMECQAGKDWHRAYFENRIYSGKIDCDWLLSFHGHKRPATNFPFSQGQNMTTPEETVPEKTSLDKTADMLSVLKEMIHYAKSNIEKLSEFWLFMEDEVKRKDFAEKLDELLDKQSALHSEMEETAGSIETEINRIKNEGGNSL